MNDLRVCAEVNHIYIIKNKFTKHNKLREKNVTYHFYFDSPKTTFLLNRSGAV